MIEWVKPTELGQYEQYREIIKYGSMAVIAALGAGLLYFEHWLYHLRDSKIKGNRLEKQLKGE